MSHDEERVNGRRFADDEEVELDSDGLPLLGMVRKSLGDPVITVRHLSKRTHPLFYLIVLFYYFKNKNRARGLNRLPHADYTIDGRQDVVKALHDIHLAPGSEFYPIRR
jgi:hypothetical protein